MDDLGDAVKGVDVEVVGVKRSPTGGNGFARFDPLEARKYTAKLPDDLPAAYDAPRTRTADAWLDQGEVGYLSFSLPRKAKVKIKVIKKGDGTQLFGGATVKLTGKAKGGSATATTANDTGLIEPQTVTADEYTLAVTLKSDDDERFFVPDLAPVMLAAGDDKEVIVEVEPVNLVTPKIEVEYKVVLLDRKLSAHQDGGEDKIVADPTYVEVSFAETNADYTHDVGAEFKCDPDNVEVYVDAECKTKLTGDLTKSDMPKGKAKKLYLRGVKAGTFKATLTLKDAPDKKKIRLDKNPAEQAMGVVELELKVHQQDASALAKLQVDPDTEPVSTYHTNLKDLALPDQKEMSDADKVKIGRVLHAQKDGNHGRARILLKKLDRAQWPAGTDKYEVVVSATNASGALAFHKKPEGDDAEPLKLTVSDLLGGDKEFWAEGKTVTDKARDIRLDVGLNRDGDGLASTPKHNGDWARFTVVQIKEVKMTVTTASGKAEVWNDTDKRFYINTDVDPDGRALKTKSASGKTIKVTAEVTPPIKDVKVHFMLVPDKDNHEKAHWGNGLPSAFKFKDLDRTLKATDRANPKDVMHFHAKTDGSGFAQMDDLVLSRFGGDKFRIGAYIDEDPHLAKYVDGASTRKPALGDAFTVWRRIWAQITRDQNATLSARNATAAGFEAAFVEYREIDEATFDTSTAVDLVTHEEWQFKPGGGTRKVLCVGGHNRPVFHGKFVAATAAHTPKAHLIMADQQWDEENGGECTFQRDTLVSTVDYADDTSGTQYAVVKPALEAGKTVVQQATWTWSDGVAAHEGTLDDGDLEVEQGRLSPATIKVTVPATCPNTCPCGGGAAIAPTATEKVELKLRLRAASGPWLGESGKAGSPEALIVILPSSDGFNNTILHEIGHMFSQVRSATGWQGLPDHPDHYEERGGQGDHCKKDAVEDPGQQDESGNNVYVNGTCVMYHDGSGVRFCDNCGADLRVRDLSDFFQ
jgi:hypothetical protein